MHASNFLLYLIPVDYKISMSLRDIIFTCIKHSLFKFNLISMDQVEFLFISKHLFSVNQPTATQNSTLNLYLKLFSPIHFIVIFMPLNYYLKLLALNAIFFLDFTGIRQHAIKQLTTSTVYLMRRLDQVNKSTIRSIPKILSMFFLANLTITIS